MSDNIERFNWKQHKIYKFINFFALIKKLKFNNNKNNKNTMSEIIKLGHYRNKYSGSGLENDSSAEIIKIIGPDKENNNLFVSSDGKKYSESTLINDWIFIYTSHKEETKKLPNSLFADLGHIDDNPIDIEETSNFKDSNQNIQNFEKITVNQPIEHSINFVQIVELTENEKFISNILEKVKGDFSLNINLNLTLDYDLEKLKNSIKLLELDENEVINFLFLNQNFKDNILNQIKNNLLFEIKNFEKTDFVLTEKEIIVEKQIIKIEENSLNISENIEIEEKLDENSPEFLELQNKISLIFKK